MYKDTRAEIVKVSPAWKPQSLNAMRRLERLLCRSIYLKGKWRKESGYIYRVGEARIFFLSGEKQTNIVGATASTLLECDEAQDVSIAKWDREISPMAASRNTTRIFWGTTWTSHTLLYREKVAAHQAELADGVRRLFTTSAEEVSREVPAYGRYVASEVAKLGRQHPHVRTQYFSEELDASGGMFPEARRLLMQGRHPHQAEPIGDSRISAFLLDFAGEDEAAGALQLDLGPLFNPGRDCTALTIVEIDLSELQTLHAPLYRVLSRMQWQGVRHTALLGQLQALAERWMPAYIVCDATGVGAGLASFLGRAYHSGKVLPFIFNQSSKSKLGWDFLAVVETGRYKEHAPLPPASNLPSDPVVLQRLFWSQVEACQMQALIGPGQVMRWSVPDGARHPESGELLHDDLLISAALCAVLDEQRWGRAESAVLPAINPFEGLNEVY